MRRVGKAQACPPFLICAGMVGTARRAPLPTLLSPSLEPSDVSAVARRAKAEAIHRAANEEWIASSLSLLIITNAFRHCVFILSFLPLRRPWRWAAWVLRCQSVQ